MQNQKFKILINCLVILGLVFPSLSLAQEIPQNLDEAKTLVMQILEKLPEATKDVWRNQALPILGKIWRQTKPIIEPWKDKLLNLLKEKTEEQIKKEAPKIKESLWQSFLERFKNLFEGETSLLPAPAPSSTPTPASFFVKPYLIYPADKPMYPQYETAVKNYLTELKNWYTSKVGKSFTMKELKVIRSNRNYLNMRCGDNPNQVCINDPSKFEGNWAQYMNEAIHEGTATYYNGGPGWSKDTADLIFSAGGGGYAGANSDGINSGWAVTGDWVLEPISGVANSWGIPCSYSSGWQCAGGVPKGGPAHELGHAFGMPHPGAQYASQSIMEWHGNYPTVGFIQQEIDFLLQSPFFK